jgi:phosphate transport system substrate-binding protein
VHPSNPVVSLTMPQLADIFTGRVSNWKELGGPDAKIVVLSREVNSGTHVYFKEHVLKKADGTADEFSPDALLMPSSQAIADEVKSNPATIGYYGMGYVSKDQKAVSVAHAAGAPAVFPTIENVISGSYPISRPLFIYTNGEPQGPVKGFMDFILSPEGQSLVAKTDFVPIQT